MMRLMGLLNCALLLTAAAPDSHTPTAPPALLDPSVTAPASGASPRAAAVRTGSHRDFGRIVVAPGKGPAPRANAEGDRVFVTLPDADTVVEPIAVPRNVRAIQRGPGRLEVTVVAGTRLRIKREGRRLVIDIVDPPAPRAAVVSDAARRPEAGAGAPRMKPPTLALPPIPAATVGENAPEHRHEAMPPAVVPPVVAVDLALRPTTIPAAGPAPPAQAPPNPSGPPALVVRPLPAEEGVGIFVPFEAAVSAAAFRRGNSVLFVFDQRRPLDLAALRGHAIFGAASVQLLAEGTLLRIALPQEAQPSLVRQAQGWQLTVTAGVAAPEPIRAQAADGKLTFAAAAPGAVITMTDPETGATLLVGTQRRAGQAMPTTRHWATFIAHRSWQGLVLEPLSDELTLRNATSGFVLSGGIDGLTLGSDGTAGERMAQADAVTRLFGFLGQSREALRSLQRSQLLDAAEAPPLARGPKRRALAQTLISLGLAPEAQTILQIAAADDPREAESPEVIGLTAIAALLAGRMEEADGLDDPRLGDGDEVRFWRAVKLATRTEGAAAAAAGFVTTVKLVQSYPEPLRERLLPLVAETLILGGLAASARALLEPASGQPSLAFAQALLAQADGQIDKALTGLDALTNGRDRLLRARAGTRSVEVRLALGDLTPATAAAGLEKLLFAWRGDARDLALRLRIAELRVQAGTWRPALAILRETEAQFPDDQAMIQDRLRASVALLLQASAMERMTPLDLVALVDENADLMPGGEAGADIAARLSDRLVALDLPRRAMPLLQKLATTTPAGPVRARFGAKLAALRLQEADAAGAKAALDASSAEGLADTLSEERSVLAARAQARLGDPVAAVGLLANLDSEAALRARAAILEESQNWPLAAAALRALVARSVPVEGKLDDTQQRSLLRLATAAAQAGDVPLLGQLREQDLPRLTPGPIADLFRLLTADSVQGIGDLPRAGRELALARALSADPARR